MKYFVPFTYFSFHFLYGVVRTKRLFFFLIWKSAIHQKIFLDCRKTLFNLRFQNFTPVFPKDFIGIAMPFEYRSILSIFCIIFIRYQTSTFCMRSPTFPSTIDWKDPPFPTEISWHLYQNQFTMNNDVYYGASKSVSLTSVTLSWSPPLYKMCYWEVRVIQSF